MNNIIEAQIKNNVIVINREQKGKISVKKSELAQRHYDMLKSML